MNLKNGEICILKVICIFCFLTCLINISYLCFFGIYLGWGIKFIKYFVFEGPDLGKVILVIFIYKRIKKRLKLLEMH